MDRMAKLQTAMAEQGLDAVALNPSPSLIYLSGLHFHLMERPTLLIVTAAGETAIVLPELEKGKLTGDAVNFRAFTYGDDPATWSAAFTAAAKHLHLQGGKMGVEPTCLRFLELGYLKEAFPGVDFVDGSAVFGSLRLLKNTDEIARMKRAAAIAQAALLATLRTVRAGMTEKAIANELIIQLLRAGSDPDVPFQPIVATGPNSANPHAVPTDRALQPGDLLLVDWGAGFEGYFSDITRTFTFGEVDPELVKIGAVVRAANEAGRKAGMPGLDAGVVDRAARGVIDRAGYGQYFTHRTGHGLGMEAHEPPYIYAENDLALVEGMTFTVEPGIYMPGRGGVRIEDDVVVIVNGLESLTNLPRTVLPIEDFIGA